MAKEQICVQGTSLFEVQFNIISHYQLQLTVRMAANKITSAPHNHDLDLDERESKEKVCFFVFFVLLQNQSSARMFQTGLVSVHTHVSRDLPTCCGCCGLHPPFRIEPHIPQLPAVFVQNDKHMRLYFFSWFLCKFPFPNY